MKEVLVLKNGSEINLEPGASLSDMVVLSASKEAMIATWDLLTEENLKSVQVKNGDGNVIGEYDNLLLSSETSIVKADGSILTSFELRQKTEVELLREEVEALKAGQEVQDGAIVELAEIIGGE